MEEQNSWEIGEYKEGEWTVSERCNLENDRVDEGDHLDNKPEAEKSQLDNEDGLVESAKDEFASDVLIF